jgi:hypothetical protein
MSEKIGTGIGTGRCGTGGHVTDGDSQKNVEKRGKSTLAGTARNENNWRATLFKTGALLRNRSRHRDRNRHNQRRSSLSNGPHLPCNSQLKIKKGASVSR